MNGKRNSRAWKRAVKIAIVCVLALDAGLLFVNWRAMRAAPASQEQRRDSLAKVAHELAADVAKGKAIEQDLRGINKECDTFYQQDLLPASSGYSTIVTDIGQVAKDAGVQSGGLNLRQSPVKDRDLNEVTIAVSVQGNYQGLIRMINALEHSPHFYVLEGLTLASETSGIIKLNLTLLTYFRT